MSTSIAYDTARLTLMLNGLRLPTIGRLWPEFTQRADKEGWQATRLLGALLEHELVELAKRRIERHRTESLATFDFSMVLMVPRAHVMALASGDAWLEKGANVLIFGSSGAGKSHLGSAIIGHGLIEAGYRVLLTRTSELVQKLQAARQNLQLPATLTKFHLIVLDDLSYVRKDQAETSVLFELIAERYERCSLLITANQPFSQAGTTCLGQRVPRSRYDHRGHRPPSSPLDHLRDERRELSPANSQRQSVHPAPTII